MKKLMSLLLVVILVCSAVSVQASARYKNDTKEDEAVKAYGTLFDLLCSSENGEDSFDGWFAGGALDENGELLVFIKDPVSGLMIEIFNSYCELVPGLEKVAKPIGVHYSLDDLLTFQKQTIEVIDDADIVSCSVLFSENKLYIGCKEEAAVFRGLDLGIPDDSFYAFIENEELSLTALHGGDYSTPAGTTLGWCGSYGGSPAIVTCAHGNYSQSSITITEDSGVTTSASRVFDSITDLSGTSRLGDFYIATVGSGLTTNQIHNSTSTLISCGSYLSSVPQGSTVYSYGKKSECIEGVTQQTYAYYVSRSESISNIVFYGLVKVNTAASHYQLPADGDSGGPVYYTYSSGGIGATGTITGRSGDGYLLYSPLKYAVNNGFSVRTW